MIQCLSNIWKKRWKNNAKKEILLLLDQASPHRTPKFHDLMKTHLLPYLYIPQEATHIFHSLDLGIIRSFKSDLRTYYMS
jgi:DDE superfamily endonuclease